jgi:hypothetical protein
MTVSPMGLHLELMTFPMLESPSGLPMIYSTDIESVISTMAEMKEYLTVVQLADSKGLPSVVRWVVRSE